MTYPDGFYIPASEDLINHGFSKFFLEADWAGRRHAHMQTMSDLNERLKTDIDPAIATDLIAQGGAVLLGFTGATAFLGTQQAELAEIARLEAQFGI